MLRTALLALALALSGGAPHLASLPDLLSALWAASEGDAGNILDPNGATATGDAGGHTDPNGATVTDDAGNHTDPDG